MIEYNYQAEMTCQLLDAQLRFMKNNNLIDTSTFAIEAFSFPRLSSSDNNMKAMTNAKKTEVNIKSTTFIAIQAMRVLRAAINELINSMKKSLREQIDKILIPLGKHDTICLDSVNITEYIRRNSKIIMSIQKDINKEITYMRMKTLDTEKYVDRYHKLSASIQELSSDLQKWKTQSEGVNVEIKIIKLTLRNIDVMISHLHEAETQLAMIENNLRKEDRINPQILERINSLLAIINNMVTFLSSICNIIGTCFSPLARMKQNISTAMNKKQPNPNMNQTTVNAPPALSQFNQ